MKKLYVLVFLFAFGFSFAQEKMETALEYQQHLNKEFADSTSSPLMKEDLVHFKTLDFFPISENYTVKAQFTRIEGEVFEMKTSTDRKPKYRVYGVLKFKMNEKNLQLYVYQNLDLMKRPGYEDYLFLPFSDLTNGKESYIGGRYLDMRIPKNETVIIDFNKAYNPYCAYNYKYSCPIVPMENDLSIEIKAGVKKFHD
ncbi:DUF1684 domain-containing protein [Flavobacterium sp. GCM10027622]|uniref:DUF1684 domain-containing protein n=1 Tax=unclassified Flavobacterium TaxID=196869 RepID=UPI00361D4160